MESTQLIDLAFNALSGEPKAESSGSGELPQAKPILPHDILTKLDSPQSLMDLAAPLILEGKVDPPKMCAVLRTFLRVLRAKPLPQPERHHYHSFYRNIAIVVLSWRHSQLQDVINVLRTGNWLKAKAELIDYIPAAEERLLQCAAGTILTQWNVSELLESYAGLNVRPGPKIMSLILTALEQHHATFEPKARRVTLQSLEKLGFNDLLPTVIEILTREAFPRGPMPMFGMPGLFPFGGPMMPPQGLGGHGGGMMSDPTEGLRRQLGALSLGQPGGPPSSGQELGIMPSPFMSAPPQQLGGMPGMEFQPTYLSMGPGPQFMGGQGMMSPAMMGYYGGPSPGGPPLMGPGGVMAGPYDHLGMGGGSGHNEFGRANAGGHGHGNNAGGGGGRGRSQPSGGSGPAHHGYRDRDRYGFGGGRFNGGSGGDGLG